MGFICTSYLCKLSCAVTACKPPALQGLSPVGGGGGAGDGGVTPSWSLLGALQPHQAQASPRCAPGASLDDQAIYICEAQNEFGKIQAEVKLMVTGHGLLLRAFVGVLILAAASAGCAGGEQAADSCSDVCS